MCVFRNMIVRSGVFIKSLMNIRTIVSIHNTSEYSLFFGAFMRGSKPPVLPGERERAERQ